MAAPRDTSPDAFALQIEQLRKAGPERRVAMAVEMSDAVLALARAHIRRRHPEFEYLLGWINALRLEDAWSRVSQP